jgi:hypothetical protein
MSDFNELDMTAIEVLTRTSPFKIWTGTNPHAPFVLDLVAIEGIMERLDTKGCIGELLNFGVYS